MLLRTGIGRLTRPLTGSLRTKLIAWFFVPTAIILVAVALVNFNSYQNVTEDLVIERDRDLTQLWAGQLATNLDRFPKVLSDVSHTLGISKQSDADVQASLTGASPQLRIFDGGVIVLDTFGTVIAIHPLRPDIVGQDWSGRAHSLQMLRSPGPIFSDVLYGGLQETEVIEVAVPITGDPGEFLGSMVGVFHLRATSISAFYSGIVRLRIGNGGSYIVDGNGKVLYHDDRDQVGADFGTQQPVTQVLLGQVGAIRNRDQQGTDQVSAFAPIPGTPWGLVTEESWSSLTSGSRNTQRYLLLLLALGVIVPAIVVAIGLKRVMRPIKALTQGAQRIAGGDFDYSIAANSGDEIQELAQQFTMMADALKESYGGLEQKVEARTEELRQAEEKYRSIVENSVEGIFQTTLDGRFLSANPSLSQMYGYQSPEDLLDSLTEIQGQLYVEQGRRDEFIRLIEQHGAVTGFESQVYRKDGSVIWISESTRAVRDESGELQYYESTVEDITERNAAQEALRESEERYRNLVDTAQDIIYTVSTDGTITSLNPAFETITGWSRSEWLGKPSDHLIHPDDLDPARDLGELVQSISPGDRPPHTERFEGRLLTKSGEYLNCEFLATTHRRDGTLIGLVGIARDITERKQAEQTLLEQTRELAVLGERNRFAREIHDTLAQGFTGIVLQLEAAEQALGESAPEVQDHMARAKGLARDSLQEARRSVWDLLPQALEQLPLDTAIREEVRRRFNGQGSFGVSGEQRPLSSSVQTALLRICQEALTNVSRHAGATRVSVKMAFHPNAVHLEVRDNGKGFDLAGTRGNHEPGGGFGLMGMEQRARQLGGTIIVDSEKGKGTVVEARIPTA